MMPAEPSTTRQPTRGDQSDPGREQVPIYPYRTARLALVERAGYPRPQVIWFYCPNCSAAEDSRLVEIELEVALTGEEKLDATDFQRRVPTIAKVLVRITRAETEQIMTAFALKDNPGILLDICRAPEDPTRVLYVPEASAERAKHDGDQDV